MRRRLFLQLIGAVLITPTIPQKSIAKLEDNEFMYRGQKFRKDFLPHIQVTQIFMQTEIKGNWYRKALWIEPNESEESLNAACDNLIVCMERTRRRVA